MKKSISTRKPERANGTVATVIDRTSTGKLSRNPRSLPFLMKDQNVSPLDVGKRGGKQWQQRLRYRVVLVKFRKRGIG